MDQEKNALINQFEPIANTMAIYKLLRDKGILTDEDHVQMLALRDGYCAALVGASEAMLQLMKANKVEHLAEIKEQIKQVTSFLPIPSQTDGDLDETFAVIEEAMRRMK